MMSSMLVDLLPIGRTKSMAPTIPNQPLTWSKGKKNSKLKQLLEPNTLDDGRPYNTWLNYLIKWKGYLESDNSWKAVANITNTKEAITEFYHRHPYTVKGMEASILALTVKLEYNRITKEDQIKKKF